ncbi:hypothetical protein RIVM261_003480 [Rivularia sp. IAM M-261]|nr:hypothetical protein CAL7716_056200 [Calothrix sp. PCC 7716]GJD15392.1 hypothetical protein RIVM261_003480 [Rivularia sp. IAM M-261]
MAATTLTSGKNICKQVTFAIVAYGASSIAFTSSLFANPAIAVTLDVSSQYVQDFNGLPNTGNNLNKSTLPDGWDFVEIGSSAANTYSANDGSSNTGGVYSFGTTGSFDRSLGSLTTSDLGLIYLGANFTIANATVPVGSVTISYKGEQWRRGSGTAVDRLAFEYSTNATTLLNGTWTPFTALDFSSPVTSGLTNTSLLGGNSGNFRDLTATITGLNLNNNDNFSIRWIDTYVSGSSGNDDGLAVNNVSIGTTPVPEPITMFGSLTALVVGVGLKKFRKKLQA